MDTFTHTALALGCMLFAWFLGRMQGYKKGFNDGLIDVWSRFLTAFRASTITIEDDDKISITDYNGKERVVNNEDD